MATFYYLINTRKKIMLNLDYFEKGKVYHTQIIFLSLKKIDFLLGFPAFFLLSYIFICINKMLAFHIYINEMHCSRKIQSTCGKLMAIADTRSTRRIFRRIKIYLQLRTQGGFLQPYYQFIWSWRKCNKPTN